MHTIADKKILMLRPCEIKITRSLRDEKDDTYSLYSLAQSIKTVGIITPLNVAKAEDGSFTLISGERRLLAARAIGLRRVPCILHKAENEVLALFTLCENLQRKNLDFFPEAEYIKQVISKYDLSDTKVALSLGIDKNTLLEKLRLLRLSENLRLVIKECHLSEAHARSLLRLPPEKRDLALEYIIKNNLDAFKTDEYITTILNKNDKPKTQIINEKPPVRKSAIGDIRLFANSLSKLTNTLNNSGIDAFIKRTENERYIEYKVRIIKEEMPKISAEQLKIC